MALDRSAAPARKPLRLAMATTLCTASILFPLLAAGNAAGQQKWPAIFDLGDLDGENGFSVEGVEEYGYLGAAVAGAGDFNGDGVDDVLIGTGLAGRAYVVFGSVSGFPKQITPRQLDGTNGFQILGAGDTVAGLGDFNGDGFDDFAVGASGFTRRRPDQGAVFVFFGGRRSFPAIVKASSLDGKTGVRIEGIDVRDYFGGSVAGVGDFNGDGFDDLLAGALHNSNYRHSDRGKAQVVFGRKRFDAVVDLQRPGDVRSITLAGGDRLGHAGVAVGALGDINADGFADAGVVAAGSSSGIPGVAVVYGRPGRTADPIDLSNLDGEDGFLVGGTYDDLGTAIAGGGDVNGDLIDDLILGLQTYEKQKYEPIGAAFVTYGRDGKSFPPFYDILKQEPSEGSRFEGPAPYSYAGRSVAVVRNADGLADVLVGSPGDSSLTVYPYKEGLAFLVFGRKGGFPRHLNLKGLDGTDGVRFKGEERGDDAGSVVASVGDVNHDGIADFAIAALRTRGERGRINAGRLYVVFGR